MFEWCKTLIELKETQRVEYLKYDMKKELPILQELYKRLKFHIMRIEQHTFALGGECHMQLIPSNPNTVWTTEIAFDNDVHFYCEKMDMVESLFNVFMQCETIYQFGNACTVANYRQYTNMMIYPKTFSNAWVGQLNHFIMLIEKCYDLIQLAKELGAYEGSNDGLC